MITFLAYSVSDWLIQVSASAFSVDFGLGVHEIKKNVMVEVRYRCIMRIVCFSFLSSCVYFIGEVALLPAF